MALRELHLDLSDQNDHTDNMITGQIPEIRKSYFYRFKGFITDIITKKDVYATNESLQKKIDWIFKSNKPSISLHSHGTQNNYSLDDPRTPVAIAEMLINQTEDFRDKNGNFLKTLKIFIYQCKSGDKLEIIDAILQEKGIGNYRLVGSPIIVSSSNHIFFNKKILNKNLRERDKNRRYKYLNELIRGKNTKNQKGERIKGEKKLYLASRLFTEIDLNFIYEACKSKINALSKRKKFFKRLSLSIRIGAVSTTIASLSFGLFFPPVTMAISAIISSVATGVLIIGSLGCYLANRKISHDIEIENHNLEIEKDIDTMAIELRDVKTKTKAFDDIIEQAIKSFDGSRNKIHLPPESIKTIDDMSLFFKRLHVHLPPNSKLLDQPIDIYLNENQSKLYKELKVFGLNNAINVIDSLSIQKRLRQSIIQALNDFRDRKTNDIIIDLSKYTLTANDINQLVSFITGEFNKRSLQNKAPIINFREDQHKLRDQMLKQLRKKGIEISKVETLDSNNSQVVKDSSVKISTQTRLQQSIIQASNDFRHAMKGDIRIDLSKYTLTANDINQLVSFLNQEYTKRLLLIKAPILTFREDQHELRDQMLMELRKKGIEISKVETLDSNNSQVVLDNNVKISIQTRLQQSIIQASNDFRHGMTDDIIIDLSKYTLTANDINQLVSFLDDDFTKRSLLIKAPILNFREDQHELRDQMLKQLEDKGIEINKAETLDSLASLRQYHTANSRDLGTEVLPLISTTSHQKSQEIKPNTTRSKFSWL